MSKRKSRDEVEPSREFPNPFAEYSGGQLVDASGKVELEILDAYLITVRISSVFAPRRINAVTNPKPDPIQNIVFVYATRITLVVLQSTPYW